MPFNDDQTQRRNAAAMGTISKLGGKLGGALAYPGQVVKGTFDQMARGVQNLPQNIRDYDKMAGTRMKQQVQGQPQSPGIVQPQSPAMGNQPMQLPPTTSAPGYVNPQQVQDLRSQQLGGTLPATQSQYGEGPSNLNQGHQRLGIDPGSDITNQLFQDQYGDLNNQDANQARFQQNRQDALNQDQASSEMVNRLNRGTQAMQELSNMRSGGGPNIMGMEDTTKQRLSPKTYGSDPDDLIQRKYDLQQQGLDMKQQAQNQSQQLPSRQQVKPPVTSGKNALTPEQQLGQEKLKFDKSKFAQEQANKSASFDSDMKNIVQSDMFKSIFREKDPNKKQYMIDNLQGQLGYSYDDILNHIKKTTNTNDDLSQFMNLK